MNQEAGLKWQTSYTTNSWGTTQASKYIEKTANKPANSLGKTVDQISIGDPELKEILKVCDLPFDTIEAWFDTRVDPAMSFSTKGEEAYITMTTNFRRDRINQRFRFQLENGIRKLHPEIKKLTILSKEQR